MKAGWEIKPLVKLTTKIGSGATPKGGRNAYKQEGIALIRSMNVHDLQFRMKDLARIDDDQAAKLSIVEVEKNDVLLNITGASISRCCVVPEEVIPARVNQHVAIVRPNIGVVDPEFLAYLLVSKEHKDALLGIGDDAGATRQALTKSHIQNYEIPIPPLEEQKRIVAVLDAAFERLTRAKENGEANLQNARELFESGLAQAVDGANSVSPTVQLSDLCISISDGDHAAPPKSEDGVPFITISNVNKETREIDFSKTFKVPKAYFEALKDNRRPRAGDVLYTVTGSFGIPVHISADKEFCFQRHIGLVRPKPSQLSRWLYYVLLSQQVFEQADKGAKGAAQRTVSLKVLRGLQVPDVGQELQGKLVDELDKLNKKSRALEEYYHTKLTDIADLQQSLLQKAFAGELT